MDVNLAPLKTSMFRVAGLFLQRRERIVDRKIGWGRPLRRFQLLDGSICLSRGCQDIPRLKRIDGSRGANAMACCKAAIAAFDLPNPRYANPKA